MTHQVRLPRTVNIALVNQSVRPSTTPIQPLRLQTLCFFGQVGRILGKRDRALLFRGWSRLCLHAASLSAAEGASAAATAFARAARAEAMEKEAVAAAQKAESWRRAAVASAEVAEAKEKTQREAARGSVLASELSQKDEDMERVVRQQKLRRMKMLVSRRHSVVQSRTLHVIHTVQLRGHGRAPQRERHQPKTTGKNPDRLEFPRLNALACSCVR